MILLKSWIWWTTFDCEMPSSPDPLQELLSGFACVTIHPLAGPHYLNLLNHSWPSDRLVVSLISGQGYFTFFTDTQNTTYTTEWVEEKRTNKHGLGLAPNKRMEKFVTLLRSFLCICGLTRACIRSKFPQSHQECWLIFSRKPTRHLSPQVPAPTLICRMPCSANLYSVYCFLLLSPGPSFRRPLPVSWDISRVSPLCGFRAKTDKRIFWLALTHLHTTNAHIVPHLYGFKNGLVIHGFRSLYFLSICIHYCNQ